MNEQMTLDFTEKEAGSRQPQPIPEPKPILLRLISFDLRADFGFFRKPDVNDGLQLSYNMLHKPALLGILGAIAGLKGYEQKGQWPEYYKRLKEIPVGIEPLDHERGNFIKTALTYTNTVGYANADGNLIIHENTLRCPAYRIYVLLNEADELQARLLTRIRNQEAEFVPYLGKNEFTAWWCKESVIEYEIDQTMPTEVFEVKTLFDKRKTVVNKSIDDGYDRFDLFDFSERKGNYIYFERLPVSFDEQLFQYNLVDFAYTDYPLKAPTQLGNLYRLNQSNVYVQLI